MNSKQAEKKLRELMRRKPEITQPGRLLAHLLNELNVADDSQRTNSTMIEAALERMANANEIELFRSGKVLNGYKVVEKSVQPKAVAVTPDAPKPVPVPVAVPVMDPAAESTRPVKEEGRIYSRAEMVTLALNALQVAADDKGRIFVQSTASLIAAELEISENEAKELNAPLMRLGLRISPTGRNPGGKRPHWVSLTVTEVTETMLTEAAAAAPEPTELTDTVVAASAEEALVAIIEQLEAQVASLTADAESAGRLAEIVEQLEARIAEQEELLGEGMRALNAKSDEVTQLIRERETLQIQVREARAQLIQRAAPSAKAQAVLQRYDTPVAAR